MSLEVNARSQESDFEHNFNSEKKVQENDTKAELKSSETIVFANGMSSNNPVSTFNGNAIKISLSGTENLDRYFPKTKASSN